MKGIRFHRLGRDNIPDVIRTAGQDCTTCILSDQDYACFLDDMLVQEVREYRHCGRLEKLADVMEVIHGIVEARGATWDELERLRAEVRNDPGEVRQQILLAQARKEA